MEHTQNLAPLQYTPYIEQQNDIENRIIYRINTDKIKNQETKLEYLEKDISVQLKKILEKMDTQFYEINNQQRVDCCSFMIVLVFFIVIIIKIYS